MSYNNLFKGEGEASSLGSITNDYQIKYTADSSFTKSSLGNTSYNWNIYVANGADEENYTTISVSGLGAGDTLHLEGTKSKTWSDVEADNNKLVVTDDTNYKCVTIKDYFSNVTKAYYEVTAGNGDNTIIANMGSNDIKLGNGSNSIELNGGFNTVNGAAGNDTYSVDLTVNGFDFTNGNIYITDV